MTSFCKRKQCPCCHHSLPSNLSASAFFHTSSLKLSINSMTAVNHVTYFKWLPMTRFMQLLGWLFDVTASAQCTTYIRSVDWLNADSSISQLTYYSSLWRIQATLTSRLKTQKLTNNEDPLWSKLNKKKMIWSLCSKSLLSGAGAGPLNEPGAQMGLFK